MKIYVHKEGKNYGPYSVSQVKEYLQTKNFDRNDLACHDGTHWIKLSQVPGMEKKSDPVTKQPIQNSSEPENSRVAETQTITINKKSKPEYNNHKKTFILAGITLASICLIVFLAYLVTGDRHDQINHNTSSENELEDISVNDKPAPKFATFDPRPAARKIDEFLYANLEKVETDPNDQISDDQFLRRAYLSVIGRIPSISEANDFHQSTSKDKHSLLVRKLLYNDAGYTAHHYQFWADLLRIPTGIDYTLYYRE